MGDAEVNTIVVGAGPAGLAVAACLRREGIPFLLLEQSDRIGAAWHRHYDRLHLHTARGFSALPHGPIPRRYPRYLSRLQFIEYLEGYARQHRAMPRFGQQVVSAERENGGWTVRTAAESFRAPQLVVTTGNAREPHLPQWPGQEVFRGTVLHSSHYRNGAAFRGKRVLVVGFGNSGGEITVDLHDHGARPSLSVRGPVNVTPREILGIPIQAIGLLQSKLPQRLVDVLNATILGALTGDLPRYGLRKLPYGPVTQIRRDRRIPLIDVGTLALIRRGEVIVYPGIERFTEDGVLFTDGRREACEAVILATGYRARVDAFLKNVPAVHDAQGTPRTSGSEAASGLFFCGYTISPGGVLRGIAQEAPRIAAAIARMSSALSRGGS